MAAQSGFVSVCEMTPKEWVLLFGSPGPGGFTAKIRIVLFGTEKKEEMDQIMKDLSSLNEAQAKRLEERLANPDQNIMNSLRHHYREIIATTGLWYTQVNSKVGHRRPDWAKFIPHPASQRLP